MKRLIPAALSLLMLSTPSHASDTEAFFIAAQGKVVLPHLNIGNQVYYVELNRLGPSSLDFRLQTQTVTVITPGTTVWATPAQLVGSWSPVDEATTTVTLAADGTFTLDSPADPTESPPCPAGRETGKYQYNKDTGVLVFLVATDANGICGTSHPDGPTRIKVSGSNLQLVQKDHGMEVVVDLIRR